LLNLNESIIKTILVTGGLGYIGSHTVVELFNKEYLKENKVKKPFKKHKFYAVIHFAGKKTVDESVEKPLFYYENNFVGTLNLIELCLKYKINNFIFSSSCTVYGNREDTKENEKMLFPINPYGRSKLFIEYMLKDTAKVEKDFKIVLLRYCNPVVVHPS